MLEGRGNTNGWLVVGGAVAALLAFTLLLYIRGGSGPRTLLTGAAPTQAPVAQAPSTPRPAASASGQTGSAQPTASTSAGPPTATRTPAPTAAVAGATSRPSPTPTKTPRPTATPRPTPTPTAAGYQLPNSPQKAVVALANGQGGCSNFPTGGVVGETSFSQTPSGRLTATSPSNQPLTGRVQANGSFTLSGTNPVERWIGTLTDTGGTGSYFIVINGCTEGYETTIAFHP